MHAFYCKTHSIKIIFDKQSFPINKSIQLGSEMYSIHCFTYTLTIRVKYIKWHPPTTLR